MCINNRINHHISNTHEHQDLRWKPNVGENHLLLLSLSSFNNRKICLQSCNGVDSYQYAGTHLQKATIFSRFPASTGRELRPPSSCIGRYVYQYVGANLHKATTFSLLPGTTFHKVSHWILLVHNNTIRRPHFIQFSYWNHQQH